MGGLLCGTEEYYSISPHKDNLKINKNSIYTTADRQSKELPFDLEWILYSKSWSKYRLKYNILLIKTASRNNM